MACPAIAPVDDLPLCVAVDAERHFQFLLADNFIHGFHRAVAFLALESRFDVAFVREMYKIRQVVNLYPHDGLTTFPIGGHFLNLGLVCRDDLVAVHAFVHAGNSGGKSAIRVNVAMHAGNFIATVIHAARVNAVAEVDRLIRTVVGKIRSVDKITDYDCDYTDEYSDKAGLIGT